MSALLTIFLLPHKVFASHNVFRDNFNSDIEGSFPNGWVLVNDPDRTPCNATWKVLNGMAGIAIVNQGSCTTNLMPSDALWNNLGDNYIFEFDMKFVNGTDHNVAFRFTPSFPSNNWYDLHFQSPGDFIIERVGGTYNTFVAGSYPNDKTYHIKIVVNTKNIKVFIDNTLVRDLAVDIDGFPTGRIALRAGTGGDPNSETYFDNIVVTNIDDAGGATLPVPYYSQNALPWGPTEYDHATSLGFSNTTMDRWGCAVTSAAMVLNYHGMTRFPDNIPLDPGSLNNWLKTNNGYLTGRGGSGSYSYLTWPAISRLTKEIFDARRSSVKLMHKRSYPSASTTTLLNDDLNIGKFPDILYVNNASTSGHFVVAKGQMGSTYAINDPEWNVPTLSSFNNRYMQVDRYIPSNTNLSYMVVVVNPDVELLLIAPNGKKTGKQIVNGQIQEFNEIQQATYAFEAPISNPDTHGTLESLGTGVNALLLPEPTGGNYKLLAWSQTNEGYTINIALFDMDGKMILYKPVGHVEPNQDDFFDINYSQAGNASAMNIVTFQSTIDDINQAKSGNLITRDSLTSNLIRTIEKAENNVLDGQLTLALRRLDHFEDTLNRNRANNIAEETYQILFNDVTYLKTHL